MTTVRNDSLIVTKEGEYVVMLNIPTLVGTRREFSTTKDIDQATSWMSVGVGLGRRELTAQFPGWRVVPCKITRTVELVTEELNLNLPKE